MLRLFLYNLAARVIERIEHLPLCGDTFIDQIRSRWQGTSPKATR